MFNNFSRFIALFWGFGFIIFPIMIMLYISLSSQSNSIPPYLPFVDIDNGALIIKPSLSSYIDILNETVYFSAYLTSLKLAFLTTIICLVIGYPTAFYIATREAKLKSLLIILVLVPFFSSLLLRTYSWMIILKKNGILSNIIGFYTNNYDHEFIDSSISVLIGMVYCYLPFMIIPLVISIEKINFSIIEAAENLGASKITTFFKIIIPMNANGILSGCTIVMIPALGEYVIPELLGGSEVTTIGKIIWSEFFLARNWPVANAIAIILCFILLIIVLISKRSKH